MARLQRIAGVIDLRNVATLDAAERVRQIVLEGGLVVNPGYHHETIADRPSDRERAAHARSTDPTSWERHGDYDG